MLWIWLCAEVLSGSVWPIYDLLLYDESVWQVCVTNVMHPAVCRSPIGVCVTNLLSILACLIIGISLGTLSGDFICVCVQMLWIWLFAEVLSGSVWPNYDLRPRDESVWQMLWIWLCAEVLSGSVWPIYFSFSRVLLWELCLKIWFTWRVCVPSLYDKCYECILVPVLSCRVLCD